VVCRKYLVGGRVQGVYYRATAARHARELALRGYAKNLVDGRVEVLVYGEEGAVQDFVQRLWTGSAASRVTSVEIIDAAADPAQVPHNFATA